MANLSTKIKIWCANNGVSDVDFTKDDIKYYIRYRFYSSTKVHEYVIVLCASNYVIFSVDIRYVLQSPGLSVLRPGRGQLGGHSPQCRGARPQPPLEAALPVQRGQSQLLLRGCQRGHVPVRSSGWQRTFPRGARQVPDPEIR